MSDHELRAHSHLGASGAHRWMNCPGSIRLSAGIPDKTSIYAAHGTAAHELGERCLRARFADANDYLGEMITVGNHQFEVDPEMIEAVNLYVQTIKDDWSEGDILFIEHRFDLSSLVEGMFGTNDAGLYKADGTVKVYDLKYGQGYAVEAENNPQLIYYAIGLLGVPSLKGARIGEVELVIIQPRAPHRDGSVRRWKTDTVHIMNFMEDLRASAMETMKPDAPLKAGPWCSFCPAAGVCPALREVAITKAQNEFADIVPDDLSEEHIGQLLEKIDLIKCGITAVLREAYSRMSGGAKVPGWKIVDKRAIRKWASDDVVPRLTMLFDLDEEQVVEKKVRSPAQVEKLLPKAERAALADLIVKASSGTTLVRESDRRPEVQPSADAVDDFDPV